MACRLGISVIERNEMMDEIKKCLEAITVQNHEHDLDLVSALKKLDEFLSLHANELDPRMRHFLQNRSYEKALLWLSGGEPKKGICKK